MASGIGHWRGSRKRRVSRVLRKGKRSQVLMILDGVQAFAAGVSGGDQMKTSGGRGCFVFVVGVRISKSAFS